MKRMLLLGMLMASFGAGAENVTPDGYKTLVEERCLASAGFLYHAAKLRDEGKEESEVIKFIPSKAENPERIGQLIAQVYQHENVSAEDFHAFGRNTCRIHFWKIAQTASCHTFFEERSLNVCIEAIERTASLMTRNEAATLR